MKELSLPLINPHAAGIDVGSRFHLLAIDQNKENVRQFGVYTCDHEQMIAYLHAHHIRTIAMESTGNYWQTLFDALQRAGFEVLLVCGSQTKNVMGKKTDMLDCLWIQKLHSLGLLSASFLPAHQVQALRTFYAHRQHLINQMSRYVNKMQKALRLMNIRLDVALRDIMGESGRAIIDAILAGETDAVKLAGLANYRVKKSREEIAKALEGNHRDDLLFELRSCLSLHDMYRSKLRECDLELEKKIAALEPVSTPSTDEQSAGAVKQRSKHAPGFNIGKLAEQYYGVDLMQIPGVSHNTVLCFLTQVGDQIHKFATSKHFCSWLRVAPNNKVTGGKVISSRTPKGKNRLALALRQAANSIGNQKTGELASFFKRVAFRKDRASAVTATARKLATIMYQMVVKKQPYQCAQPQKLPDRVKNKMIKNIKASAARLELTEEQLQQIFCNTSLSAT